MKKKVLKKIMSLVLGIVMCMQLGKVDVMAATTVSNTSIKLYAESTGQINTYKSVSGSYSGYIDGKTDQCEILEIYDSGWCKVKYPTSRGMKEAYTETENFFSNIDFDTIVIQLGNDKTVYRRSDLSQSYGTVYGTDNIIIVGQQNGNTQIIYPLDTGGYKSGWVEGSYSVNGEIEADLKDGWYQIHSAINTDYVIDVYGGFTDNCTNIILYRNQMSLNEVFLIQKQGNGYYTIKALHSGLYFDVEGGTQNVIQYTLNGETGSDNQLWKIYKTSDGYYRFQSKATGMYLDCNGCVAENGTNIQVWESNDSYAQIFMLQECRIDGKTYVETVGENEGDVSEEIRKKIVEFELSQVGVSDYKGDNNVIYNTWFYDREISGNGYAWCQAFQSYAANQVGVLDTSIPKTANCRSAVEWFMQRGEFYLREDGYIPKAGDLIFYGNNGGSHVGMIIDSPTSDGYLCVVEGNVYDDYTGNYSVQVFTHNNKRRVDSSYVYGYASPSY